MVIPYIDYLQVIVWPFYFVEKNDSSADCPGYCVNGTLSLDMTYKINPHSHALPQQPHHLGY
jgi:hypothetical protein